MIYDQWMRFERARRATCAQLAFRLMQLDEQDLEWPSDDPLPPEIESRLGQLARDPVLDTPMRIIGSSTVVVDILSKSQPNMKTPFVQIEEPSKRFVVNACAQPVVVLHESVFPTLTYPSTRPAPSLEGLESFMPHEPMKR